MMESLIYNEILVRNFCKHVLPELRDDEVLIMTLFSRRKYGGVQELLNRAILRRTDSNYVLRKIKRMSYVDDVYIDRTTGEPIPTSSMVLYIDLIPKSTVKAIKTFNREMYEWLYSAITSDKFDRSLFRRIDIKLFSAIHRSSSRRPFFLIDVDDKTDWTDPSSKLYDVLSFLDERYIQWVTETKGGFHVLVDRTNETGRVIFKYIRCIDNVEVHKEVMTPIPGTLQGGFEVKGWTW